VNFLSVLYPCLELDIYTNCLSGPLPKKYPQGSSILPSQQ